MATWRPIVGTMLVVVAVGTVLFSAAYTFQREATQTSMCEKHGTRSTQVRSWSKTVCRDDRGVLYDFGD